MSANRLRAPKAARDKAETQDLNDAVDRLVVRERNGAGGDGAKPSRESFDLRRILVGVDGSEESGVAVGWAIGLARLFGARVWVITVMGPIAEYARYARHAGWKVPKEQMAKLEEQEARRILDASLSRIRQAKVDAEGILVRGFPSITIGRAADKNGVDLVILGSHGHDAKERLTLGSVVDGVKNSTHANILIAKNEYRPGEILAPVDGSEQSRLAAGFALRLGRLWKTSANVLHIYEVPWLGWPEWGEDAFRGIIRRLELPTKPRGVRYRLDFGKPAAKIVRHATRERAALIVMGSRGRGRVLRGLHVGGVSGRVSHEARTSILLIKPRRP